MAVAEREEENPLVEGLERLPVPGTSLVIFGATGDLARRKLLPALYNLAHEGALPERFNLIGVSRRDQSDDDFREFAREAIKEFSRRPADERVLGRGNGHRISLPRPPAPPRGRRTGCAERRASGACNRPRRASRTARTATR